MHAITDPAFGLANPRRGPGRWLRVLLCLLVLPLSLVLSAVPAQAVVKYSNGATIEYDAPQWGNNIPGWGFECKFPVFTQWMSTGEPLNGGTVTDPDGELFPVVKNAHCELGFSVGNNHRVKIDFTGSSGTVGACSATIDSQTYDVDVGGTVNGTGQHFLNGIGQNAPDCDVTQVCVELWGESGQQSRGRACEGVAMPSPMPTETVLTCQVSGTTVTPARPALGGLNDNPSSSGRHYYTRDVTWNVTNPVGIPGDWYRYTVHAGTPSNYVHETANVIAVSNSIVNPIFVVQNNQGGGPTGWPFLDPVQVGQRVDGGTSLVEHFPIIGAGMVYAPTYRSVKGLGSTAFSTAALQTVQQTTTGIVGRTEASACAFYWGDKIGSTASDEFDEPIDPLGDTPGGGGSDEPPEDDTPPIDPRNDCGFSLGDPSSWLEGGMCLLVGLMRTALDILWDILGVLGTLAAAVAGLVANLVAALGTLLMDLLIPSPGSWDFEGLVDQFKAKPPFSVADEVAGGAAAGAAGYTSAGDCGELFEVGSETLTCDQVKNAPGISVLYQLVQAGLWVLTAFILWNMARGSIKER